MPKKEKLSGRISKDCKYFKNCPLKEGGHRPCVKELKMLYGVSGYKKGSILWSIEVCYALIELIKKGIVTRSLFKEEKEDVKL